MAGKDVAAKGTAAADAEPPKKSVARRLWRVARAVLYMLRHGGVLPSGRKVAMDLGLLLRRRGKVAGRAPGGLANFHHHHGAHRHHHEVEFSYTNTDTPSPAAAAAWCYDSCDAADIARVFEMLNDDSGHLFDDDALAVLATPSPAMWTMSAGRQLRVTDSPFAATGTDAAAGEQQEQVDRKADEFIRRFYEQLRAQRSAPATPDSYGAYAASSYNGHAPRQPVAAGIA